MRNVLIRILQAVVLVAVASSFAHADNPMYFKKKAAAGGCGPVGSFETVAANTPFGRATGTTHYVAFSFTTTGAGTIHEFQVKLADTGSPLEVIQLALCTSDGGSPPAPTTTCTNADSTFTGTTGALVWFAGEFTVGYAVSDATTYFARLYTAQASDTNYYNVGTAAYGTNQTSNSADGISWTSLDTTATGNFRATTCTNF